MAEDCIREALLYERLGNKVRCNTCERRVTRYIITPEQRCPYCGERITVIGEAMLGTKIQ